MKQKIRKYLNIAFLIVFPAVISCTQKPEFTAGFDNTNDRVWIGKDFWSVPLEDWKVEDGKLLCTGSVPHSRVNLLTRNLLPGSGSFEVSVSSGLIDEGEDPGSAGLLIGVHDPEDADVRAACYFGKSVQAGISLRGFVFLKDKKAELPEGFNYCEFKITVSGSDNRMKMKIVDKNGIGPEVITCSVEGVQGMVAVANNLILEGVEKTGNSTFWFDDLKISGTKLAEMPENAFGPVLWTMYTLSKSTLKLMALLPPVGDDDNKNVSLQLKKGDTWETVATQSIEPDSRTAVFKLENWDATQDVEYRVEYIERNKDGTEIPEYYAGTIRKDPVNRPLKFGGLTCQYSSGFPYTPLVNNLTKLDPDILYFSGDQIYEANGGYQIKRGPEDVSILNYLGKYYMFGWAFGDLMRDRPTICTPDDHDVFHGNLWGEEGEPMAAERRGTGSNLGFIQSVKMVNVVNRTQCGQLPDPYDPTSIKQEMSVWYTDLTYGRVSFAIISDRIFKSGPERVSFWEGRNDHLKEPLEDFSLIDNPDLELVGGRQMEFLNDWIMDWEGADMKVLLSQTVFANAATHHGSLDGSLDGFLHGDLDSGGWPKTARDNVVKLIRKAAAFHINGDQHLPTLVQYGLDNYRDAGWSFCTPPISSIYVRWFLADEVGYPVLDRPGHGYPNTGKYTDAFGNKNYVYAVGNPGEIIIDRESRYNQSQLRVSGFGIITFDQVERTIAIDAWRFFANVEDPNPVRDQFPGWPFEISQFDNLGMGAENVLPMININKSNQLIQVWSEKTGELVQIYRIKGSTVQPKLYESGTFTVIIGEGEETEKITGLKPQKKNNTQTITVALN